MQNQNQNSARVQKRNSTDQRLLLQIEDNQANALLFESIIARRRDLKLLTASSGYGGIEMADTYSPDLIIMDINMPDISGLDALNILRESPATRTIPVIALSSNAYPRQIKEGLNAGFFQYLTKPYRIQALLAAIDMALGITNPSSLSDH